MNTTSDVCGTADDLASTVIPPVPLPADLSSALSARVSPPCAGPSAQAPPAPRSPQTCVAAVDLTRPTSLLPIAGDPPLALDAILEEDFLEILGEDPSQATVFGKEIHLGLAKRLEHISVNGLDNNSRKEILKKYLVPNNCTLIGAPLLNAEIKAALPEPTWRRDKGIEARQKQLAVAISCLSGIISTHIRAENKDESILKQLMDASRLICDIQHSDSMKRRHFALTSLKKDINEHLLQTKIDKYLFGANLSDTIKTAKTVSKSGADIKVTYNNKYVANKKLPQSQPSTSRALNWRAPPPGRRPLGPQRSRPPPAARRPAPPAPSSSTSRGPAPMPQPRRTRWQ